MMANLCPLESGFDFWKYPKAIQKDDLITPMSNQV